MANQIFHRIRDPLHDLIQFKIDDEFDDAMWKVIQTRPYQRLRRVKQLGFSDLVYPGATHSRYAHSLGVFHTARRLMDVIKRNVTKVQDTKVARSLAAALVHDLGHGAFSHAFEKVGKRLNLDMANHEKVSDALIRDSEVTAVLNNLGGGFADDVADVIQGAGEKTIYQAVVSSQFDADRLDYMRRDRLMTGTQHAGIDYEWLLENLEIGNVPLVVDDTLVGEVQTLVLGTKATHAAEAYVLGLFQLYPTVYLHKTTRGAELIFVELITHLIKLCLNGSLKLTGLPATHPIMRFARDSKSLQRALDLDDAVVWGALPLMVDAKDPLISQFAARLRDRNLYKCVDFRNGLHQKLNPMDSNDPGKQEAVDASCARVGIKIQEWSEQNSKDIPRILLDSYARTPYKSVSNTPLDQINIKTSSGSLVDLRERSQVVAALQIFKLDRAYVASDDTEARAFINNLIQDEAK